TAIEDPGLVVLPTHRIIRDVAPDDLAALPDRLGEHFTLEALLGTDPHAWLAALPEASTGGNPTLVLILPTGASLATLTAAGRAARAALPRAGPRPPDAWRPLDVPVFQQLVLKRALGTPDEATRGGERLSYPRAPAAAVEAVRTGKDG